MEHVQPQRIGPAQQHVYPQIEFEAVEEVGTGEVPLNDVVFAVL